MRKKRKEGNTAVPGKREKGQRTRLRWVKENQKKHEGWEVKQEKMGT